VLLEFSLT